MKKEIRILGIDDAPFDKFNDKESLIIGTLFRGGSSIDGIMSTKATVDGIDSTGKLTEMINSSKFKSHIQYILLDGIAVCGFNIIDINKLSTNTSIPVIVVSRTYPNFEKIKQALIKINQEEKYKFIIKAGKVHKINKIYIQFIGTGLEDVKKVIKLTCTNSFIPEPIRISHLIASGVIKGESSGNP